MTAVCRRPRSFFADRRVVRCVIAAAAKKKRKDDTQAADIAAPTSDTGVNALGRSNFAQAQHHLAESS
jgi:hypothetical protein